MQSRSLGSPELCFNEQIAINQINEAVAKMKGGKAALDKNLTHEHLQYSPAILRVHLANLFTIMARHGIVQKIVMRGVLVPILKTVGRTSLKTSEV